MVASKDRTNELHQIFEEVRARRGGAGGSSISVVPPKQMSNFNKKAQLITKELTGTAEMLENLSKLTQQRSVFNDHSPEVNQITIMTKERIANLHQQLKELAALKDEGRGWGMNATQAVSHSDTVVSSLQRQLWNTQKTFKDVLTSRTKKMKAVTDRRKNFVHDSSSTFGSSLFRNAEDEDKQQELMVRTGDNRTIDYLKSRKEGVKMIEKTVEELSELFSDFTRIVAEQQEQLERIDNNTEEALDLVTDGQTYLVKYLSEISSNRSLILKIFGILFVFVIVFGLLVVN
eukprot:TRINITY_DN22299_c0_g1_i1.p1 TRINITY_DN22299_c0_g1~~TRINITY_DN22299_c0_g1_i1.p1  ORF type:complete len:289 (+),score=103.22 TRINITY_DN22299_c0_g1_i1:143-1009(+)